ncbi:MAG: cytochrome aa3 quinol oxidase subunit III [Bacillota bacterium]|jgi:cytochrome aa3-600 menaquinol oxidase subunit 3|uniref:Quinol oxidase subunit 3 n=1 Tax=Cytobacillus oceanisediminis 2691 TaxID=1196031 RepID=A0A169G2P6_9BACI|nr:MULTISPECIES: cytochrome aa3 quinol oxidase subunit III [Bacillaceae]AND42931.1 cytochrome o ubiquinol oxidase subunit III [Cytobacillus oceanisediminis 2691]MBN8202733.1 cytochrome aa3 quinol oxidase subunit III [Bacillus sp. NTK034]MCM3244697.1 cytochrome aa3 quinol oxidase subunit III [Cytobacillus oceanisediminis]UQX56920.1 cytochrome aa3 quinol oxidase subunit III [Cytobacillus pseudoceanisediminis]USK47450.1 cytochrome aa3 quinol oxidase subunit III [Cytobacillus oceanisediminis]
MKIDHSLPLEYGTEQNRLNILGFWIFLGAEIALFGTLFASYFTLVDRTGSGPSGAEIFEITPVLIETILLLTSSFTIGLGIHAMRLGKAKAMITFFAITLLLGLGFLGVEIYDFIVYVHEGATLQTSGFTAILFLTLGTHGAHVTFGLFWGAFIILQVIKRGLTPETANKAFIFSLYWHFLDVVWIFIFSFVFLKGMI